jgi:hypothetical protein
MGREVKRVAKDFDWPLKKVWEGFLNPHYQHLKECPFCDHSGYNPETKKISDGWYSFDNYEWKPCGSGGRYNNLAWCYHLTQDEVNVLAEKSRLMDFTHTWSRETGWVKKDPPVIPTAEQVNEWSKTGFGHDAINRSICVETRAKRFGVYGLCPACNGEGSIWRTPEDKINAEQWAPTNPPAGDWYQMWETTTEGSPMSPPFETPEELAQWLFDNKASSMGSQTSSYEQWLNFIKGPGWAPSMIMTGGHVMSGVEGCSKQD